MSEIDAILLVSFGGPEGPDDVMPFLRNVVRGRNVPDERLEAVAHHYHLFGGVSPINEQNRSLIRALETEIDSCKLQLPIYWGNRNWHPLLEDTVEKMAADGVRHALAIATSAYSSYSGCRQYLEDIERARLKLGDRAPRVDKIRPFFDKRGFIDANIARVKEALTKLPDSDEQPHVAFSAHSIPISMASCCRYEEQLNYVAHEIAESLQLRDWQVVYQSRSGPPSIPWLEPDINTHVRRLHASGKNSLVVSPIGFVSDHMEVIYDLDVEAAQLAHELGMTLIRAETVGTHPLFVATLRELICESAAMDTTNAQVNSSTQHLCDPACCARSADAAAQTMQRIQG